MQHREGYAVPGNITSRNSFGTNYFVKGAGAKLAQTWQDVAAELLPEIAARILPPGLKAEVKGREGCAPPPPVELSDGDRAVLEPIPAEVV